MAFESIEMFDVQVSNKPIAVKHLISKSYAGAVGEILFACTILELLGHC